MKLALIAAAALFSLFTLIESSHSHQFLHDDCCQSMCGGSMAENRGMDPGTGMAPPQRPVARLVLSPRPCAADILETDIFHPPVSS